MQGKKAALRGPRPGCLSELHVCTYCHEPTDTYSVSYVKNLEQQVAGLQARLSEPTGPLVQHARADVYPDLQSFTDPANALYLPPISSENTDFDFLSYQDESLFSIAQPPPTQVTDQVDPGSYSADDTHSLDPSADAIMTDISVREGASFFQTYFEIIHPRYPFLDVEECSTAYLKWKTGEIHTCTDKSWPLCLLKLIFANGAVLQHAWLDHTTRRQRQEFTLQEQSIIAGSAFKPLYQVQAMLLHVLHALHGENTARVVHITGIAMRVAILHGFHTLTDDGTAETDMKIKAWWCIYCLDKVVVITLRIPPYPPNEWIETPAYQPKPEPPFFMPWAADVLGSSEGVLYSFDLRYFAHMCSIRRLHSEILTITRRLHPDSIDQRLQELRAEIDRWVRPEEVFADGPRNSEGHASPLGMTYVAHMTRVVLYSSVPFETASETADKLLQACCDSCTTFRALQKRKHLPKHWFDMLFIFQVGVTVMYIVWRRAVPISKAVDRAIRDCTAILSIFADRSQNADVYHDCMDLLASSITRASTSGNIDIESRQELAILVRQMEENRLASHANAKLLEMCKDDGAVDK
ncbi:hypothetical protein B0J13DRAFT_628936 [Dactylonectria estremocensis]|uniref:Xylanolytic transcriptional activator regulatory domain-containing protein n=1 Tax=Dactylonectria estremocensis TaxID=1079267 RepID=A0A9P9DJG4_9HYPO|nr:hypothetical protein B0J13DRAFT_628936 [Dactylonectria estremocensis]